jgi:hypothetical protein
LGKNDTIKGKTAEMKIVQTHISNYMIRGISANGQR